VLPDGRTSFNLIQNATDTGQGALVFFLFDLLYLNGENLMALPLVERKTRLASLLNGAPDCLRYNDHQIDHGPAFHRLACEHGVEGIISKRTNARYEPDRRTWLKMKCLNREEFVVVGWSDPERSRHRIGSLPLGYYTPQGELLYAGRVGTGMPVAELERLWQRLQPLIIDKMPLAESPPRGTRFGSPLVLSRVHWVRPEMVAEVSYVEWTPDGLLRHVVYLGERQDKLATEVRRSRPHAGETLSLRVEPIGLFRDIQTELEHAVDGPAVRDYNKARRCDGIASEEYLVAAHRPFSRSLFVQRAVGQTITEAAIGFKLQTRGDFHLVSVVCAHQRLP